MALLLEEEEEVLVVVVLLDDWFPTWPAVSLICDGITEEEEASEDEDCNSIASISLIRRGSTLPLLQKDASLAYVDWLTMFGLR